MKTIMILGAGDYQLPLVQEAAKTCRVVLVAPEIGPRFLPYADRTYLLDVREEEEILKIARAERIDGIITDQTDIPVRTVAYVAEQMDLPGIGSETGFLFTNKSAMRERLHELGLPVLPYCETDCLEEAETFFRQAGGRCIIKPEDNQGSRGVAEVNSLEELRAKYDDAARYSRKHRVIIEKMAQGREFVLEGMVAGYDYRTLICGDTHYFDLPDVFAAKMRVFPSQQEPKLVERVCRLNEKIIRGFGLRQGITHSEFIMDGDEIYLLETAARGGGVFISSDLIRLGSGLNTERFLIELALGERDSLPELEPVHGACGYMALFLPEGEVTQVEGVEAVKALPFVHRHQLDKLHVGLRSGKNADKTSRFAIIVDAPDYDSLMARMDRIRSLLHVTVERDGVKRGIIWA